MQEDLFGYYDDEVNDNYAQTTWYKACNKKEEFVKGLVEATRNNDITWEIHRLPSVDIFSGPWRDIELKTIYMDKTIYARLSIWEFYSHEKMTDFSFYEPASIREEKEVIECLYYVGRYNSIKPIFLYDKDTYDHEERDSIRRIRYLPIQDTANSLLLDSLLELITEKIGSPRYYYLKNKLARYKIDYLNEFWDYLDEHPYENNNIYDAYEFKNQYVKLVHFDGKDFIKIWNKHKKYGMTIDVEFYRSNIAQIHEDFMTTIDCYDDVVPERYDRFLDIIDKMKILAEGCH